MGKTKSLIIIAILSISIVASFCFPKTRYQSFDIIEYLNIPLSIKNWSGSEMPNNDEKLKKNFNFINNSKQYYFWKEDGTEIYFSLLNAGNFHNPKICYTGIGYKPRHEGTHNIKLAKNTTLQLETYLMLKENNTLITTFWMCIDGKRVNWVEQKLLELTRSITNRQSINVSTRIDVPTNPENSDNALAVTKNFISDLYETLDKNKKVYIFGK
jgi:hypothetical protein